MHLAEEDAQGHAEQGEDDEYRHREKAGHAELKRFQGTR